MREKPYLAPFTAGGTMILRPIGNGGWIVSGEHASGSEAVHEDLGAFSNVGDMLEALNAGLAPLVPVKPGRVAMLDVEAVARLDELNAGLEPAGVFDPDGVGPIWAGAREVPA